VTAPSGFSMNDFDAQAVAWMVKNVASDAAILDVGAGYGKWGRLLKPTHSKIDALEVFPHNVLKYDLFHVYRRVHIDDVRRFKIEAYEFVILGDLLEHLPVPDAQFVLARCRRALVQVPFLYKQGELDGNPYEVHVQDDLTAALVAERYPSLMPLAVNEKVGVYVK